MIPPASTNRRRGSAGFSLVELLVALVLAAAVLTVTAIVFGTLTSGPRASVGPVTITLDSAVLTGLYGMGGTSIEVPVAPSYGARMQADLLREEFWSDVRKSNAVFCLGRNVRNTVHPATITMTVAGRSIDTPDMFRALLALDDTDAATIFIPYTNVSTATNGTIFVLKPSGNFDELAVRSIYEIDVVRTPAQVTPAGTYVSVQRYAPDQNGVMVPRAAELGNGYFHVFYPDDPAPPHAPTGGTAPTFTPLFVFFPREALSAVVEGVAIDRFKVAQGRPFYFIFWPDPTMPGLGPTSTPTYAASVPREAYGSMGGRTSYFFAVPMMPPL